MGRVRTIYIVQSLLTTTTFSIVAFAVALWGVGREVWVARVFADMPTLMNVTAVAHFYLAAFINTRFIVQVLVIISATAFIWFTYSISRTLRVGMRLAV